MFSKKSIIIEQKIIGVEDCCRVSFNTVYLQRYCSEMETCPDLRFLSVHQHVYHKKKHQTTHFHMPKTSQKDAYNGRKCHKAIIKRFGPKMLGPSSACFRCHGGILFIEETQANQQTKTRMESTYRLHEKYLLHCNLYYMHIYSILYGIRI